MSNDAIQDEQKTERFNMFLSPSEMKAIEEWAWQNRVRSKSEAVRRLCQIGLLVGAELGGISGKMEELSEAMTELDRQTFDVWMTIASPVQKGDKLDRRAVVSVVEKLRDRIRQVDAGADEVYSVLVGLFQGVSGLSRAATYSKGQEVSEKALQETIDYIAKIRKLRAERDENWQQMREYRYGATEGERDE